MSNRKTHQRGTFLQAIYDSVRLLLAVYGALVLLALLLAAWRFLPAEDAVILWTYSRNLALHGAVSYVAGGPPVEGATDFAWMLCVAAAMRCGIDPFVFTGIVNTVCLVWLAALLLRMAACRVTVPGLLRVAGAAGCTPQIFAAASGFATLPDALLLTATVYHSRRHNVLKATVCAVVLCLFRPDGIVFAVPLLAVLLWRSSDRRRDVRLVVSAFVLPGVTYFAWRSWYFHEWLPLPFFVKADAHRVLHTVVAASVRTSLVFLVFTLMTAAVVWRCSRRRALLTGLLVPLVCVPTAFYWCMRLDQNVAFRFYFYLLLAAAIMLACYWQLLLQRKQLVCGLVCVLWLLLIAMPLRREFRTFLDLQSPQLRDIALQLGRIQRHGLLLSSEAGILPYYSGWQSVDPWGLNTPAFAHNFFQPADVQALAPSLIHLHPDQGEGCVKQNTWLTPYRERSWQALTRNLIAGAAPDWYDLWQTSYGADYYRRRKHWRYGEGDVNCWFVRRGTVEQQTIESTLAKHNAVFKGRADGTPRPSQ